MKRCQTAEAKKLLSETDKCELCGNRRRLEVHHIIPVSYGGPEDDTDNMIVICEICHTKLTPKNILIKHGMDKGLSEIVIWRIYKRFYELMNDVVFSEDFDPRGLDEYDIFDKVIDHELILAEMRKGTITSSDINNFDISIIHGTKIPKVKDVAIQRKEEVE